MIYLLTAIGLSSGGSTHLHSNNRQDNTNNNRTKQITTNVEECGPCPVFAGRAPSLRAVPRLCGPCPVFAGRAPSLQAVPRLCRVIGYFPCLKQTLTQTRFFFKSTHRKSKITRSTHRNKHPLTSKTGSYGCRTHWTDTNDGDTTVFHGRELFYLPFSVLSVREILDKSSHVLIFICLFFCS
jgi:hypothetical protein